MRAEPWPITCRARSRSGLPPASTRPRGTAWLVTVSTAVVVPRWGRRRPRSRSETVAGARPAAVGDGAVGAAVLAQPADVSAGRAGPGTGYGGLAWLGTGPAAGLMLISVHRLGLVAGRFGAGLAGAAGGVQGPGDFLVAKAGLAGGVGQRAQVGGGVGFQGAVGGPVQAGVAVAFGLAGDPARQGVQVPVRGRAGSGPVPLRLGGGSARLTRSQLRVPSRPGVPQGR